MPTMQSKSLHKHFSTPHTPITPQKQYKSAEYYPVQAGRILTSMSTRSPGLLLPWVFVKAIHDMALLLSQALNTSVVDVAVVG
jgi:hypothetical protein